ncbi:MAG TPA: dual specificity protein phosphatase family protein [Gammaproteobacteria bacterium]|nr:dual specificity protein phosphatase family protein [Gammaproteobacteria bacterium]
MKHVFWLEPGRIAGRCGPNLEPWDPVELYAHGIGAVISLNNAERVYPDEFAALGMRYTHVPLSNAAPPRPGDLELNVRQLPVAFDWITSCLNDGLAVLMHCRSGKDRTGLLMAYYLARRFCCEPDEAVARVKAVRPIAFSSEGWGQFAIDMLSALNRWPELTIR